eukprot:6464849-Amphidinium_carterae.5
MQHKPNVPSSTQAWKQQGFQSKPYCSRVWCVILVSCLQTLSTPYCSQQQHGCLPVAVTSNKIHICGSDQNSNKESWESLVVDSIHDKTLTFMFFCFSTIPCTNTRTLSKATEVTFRHSLSLTMRDGGEAPQSTLGIITQNTYYHTRCY